MTGECTLPLGERERESFSSVKDLLSPSPSSVFFVCDLQQAAIFSVYFVTAILREFLRVCSLRLLYAIISSSLSTAMCFNIYWSSGFSALGLLATIYIKQKTSNGKLALGVFFFFLMEFLQVVQYIFIANDLKSPVCETTINQVLTVLGFLHICCQPYFLATINCSLLPVKSMKPDRYKLLVGQYDVIKKLTIIGGALLFARWPMAYVKGWDTLQGTSTEWLRGDNLCTYKTSTMFHLGWSVPMADPTYNIMGTGIHSFLMFAPFLAMAKWGPGVFFQGMFIQGVICYATGPFMAAMVTSNLQEQASVWCLFSIAQILLTLFRVTGMVKKNYPAKQ